MATQNLEPEKTLELADYAGSLRRRKRLIFGIWLPIVVLAALLAVGLPNEYGSTATFQLKTDINDQSRNDNYADRYVSSLTANVLGSPELRAALATLAPYPRLAEDPAAALKKLQGDVRATKIGRAHV